MFKHLFILLLLSVSLLFAEPATFTIKKAANNNPITVDGDLSDWSAENLITTLDDGQKNVYFKGGSGGGNHVFSRATDWDGELYGIFDDSLVYFAVKNTVDDDIQHGSTGGWEVDYLKINLGFSDRMAMFAAGSTITVNGSFDELTNCKLAINSTGNNDSMPIYEFSITRELLDLFNSGMFKLSIGPEDNDAVKKTFLGFGADNPDSALWKIDLNQWDDISYYATYVLEGEAGVVVNYGISSRPFTLHQNSPNPFSKSTEIFYTIPQVTSINNTKISIFTLDGEMIKSMDNVSNESGTHKVVFDGRDNQGNLLESGVYFYRIESGGFAATKKLILRK
ncbi:MAG: T9SS type A sorting domain-containing protein [bacterium]